MTQVTLHPATGDPAELTAMVQALTALAPPGQRHPVRSGHGGLVVDESLAHAYLTWRLSAAPPWPPVPVVAAAPPQLAGVVRGAETAAGIAQQRLRADTAPPRKAARPTRAVPRTEEHSHV